MPTIENDPSYQAFRAATAPPGGGMQAFAATGHKRMKKPQEQVKPSAEGAGTAAAIQGDFSVGGVGYDTGA